MRMVVAPRWLEQPELGWRRHRRLRPSFPMSLSSVGPSAENKSGEWRISLSIFWIDKLLPWEFGRAFSLIGFPYRRHASIKGCHGYPPLNIGHPSHSSLKGRSFRGSPGRGGLMGHWSFGWLWCHCRHTCPSAGQGGWQYDRSWQGPPSVSGWRPGYHVCHWSLVSTFLAHDRPPL